MSSHLTRPMGGPQQAESSSFGSDAPYGLSCSYDAGPPGVSQPRSGVECTRVGRNFDVLTQQMGCRSGFTRTSLRVSAREHVVRLTSPWAAQQVSQQAGSQRAGLVSLQPLG